MFIEHIDPFLWYKLLKTSQKMSTLSTNLYSEQKQITHQNITIVQDGST
jgi:hypothetical protein